MQSKDIILQVSEETAVVMEEISGQLFDESEARFDEIVEAIGYSVKKIEKLYADFTGYAGKADARLSSNQTEVLNKFGAVLEALGNFKKHADEQSVKIEDKSNRLIEIISDVPQLIQAVSNGIFESSESTKEFESSLMQAVKGLAENLMEVHKVQSTIVDKLHSDDSNEKMTSTLNKLSKMEKEILQTKDAIDSVDDTLHNCNTHIEKILSSVKGLQESDGRILDAIGKNAKKVDELSKQDEENAKLLLNVLTRLDTLSHSIQTISDKQSELCEKQAILEKDVKYLKLPFFKRWFMKG